MNVREIEQFEHELMIDEQRLNVLRQLITFYSEEIQRIGKIEAKVFNSIRARREVLATMRTK
ncbi:hypothetical protein C1V00_002497 [Escherichia coli]|nr:hypothetical protein [Escherichia coli]